MGRIVVKIQEVWDVCGAEDTVFWNESASSGWEDDCARRLVIDGFQRGRAASPMIHHLKTRVRAVVYGDDFTFVAMESELRKMRSMMYDVAFSAVESVTCARLRCWEEA